MLRGIYAAASGLLTQQHALDVAATNISNVNTDGYKRARTFFAAYRQVPLRQGAGRRAAGMLTDQVRTPATVRQMEDGALRETGVPTDFALQGEGFFRVRYAGQIRYRRAGSFRVDADGFLVDENGGYLLDAAGEPIRWNPEQPIRFDESGRGGGVTLAVVTFAPGLVAPQGDGYWAPVEGAEEIPAGARILQGYLEASNVDLAEEIAQLIMAQRQFQASSRALQAHAEMAERAVRDLSW